MNRLKITNKNQKTESYKKVNGIIHPTGIRWVKGKISDGWQKLNTNYIDNQFEMDKAGLSRIN